MDDGRQRFEVSLGRRQAAGRWQAASPQQLNTQQTLLRCVDKVVVAYNPIDQHASGLARYIYH